MKILVEKKMKRALVITKPRSVTQGHGGRQNVVHISRSDQFTEPPKSIRLPSVLCQQRARGMQQLSSGISE